MEWRDMGGQLEDMLVDVGQFGLGCSNPCHFKYPGKGIM